MSLKIRFFGPLIGFAMGVSVHSQPLSSYANPEPPAAAVRQSAQIPGLAQSPQDKAKSASVVITVGPSKIRRNQIDTLVELMARAKRTNGEMDSRDKNSLEKMVATNLIGQELLALEAQRLKLVVPEIEIDSLSKVFRGNFPDEATFKRALAQAGDTEKGLREKIIRQLKADKLLNGQMAAVEKPTTKDLQDHFNAHKKDFPVSDSLRACQIVLIANQSLSPADAAKMKADLERVRTELAKDSADMDMLLNRFVMAAQQVSDGPEKKDGGDLQRFAPNDFNPEFKKQVIGLKVGQMSTVFRTPLGFHLVLLTERYDGKFESYRLQISRILMQEKAAVAGKNLKKYLQSLAAKFKVTYMEASLKDNSAAGVYNL